MIKNNMKRYFIKLAYNGSKFHGWQIQNNAITVQETLNKALSTVLRSDINVVGAGRTDTGVHASYFVAHFDLETEIADTNLIINKLNKILPKDIAIYNLWQVNNDAHSRFSAISRTYEYRIHNIKNPFLQNFSWYYRINLDIEKMNEAAELLFAYTDFSCFSKSGTQVASNNCKIMYAKWQQNGSQMVFTIKADRFLRNMVRAIVGTLIDVGLGKISKEDFKNIIESKNRSKAGFSVPACGLFLTDIEYNDNDLKL